MKMTRDTKVILSYRDGKGPRKKWLPAQEDRSWAPRFRDKDGISRRVADERLTMITGPGKYTRARRQLIFGTCRSRRLGYKGRPL
jgi:hypothetical protein